MNIIVIPAIKTSEITIDNVYFPVIGNEVKTAINLSVRFRSGKQGKQKHKLHPKSHSINHIPEIATNKQQVK